jgi:DNA-binding NarL/FixJ family response regulator
VAAARFECTRWTAEKAAQAVRISKEAAATADWSFADTIPSDHQTPLFKEYEKKLADLSNRYFPQNEGDVSIVVVRAGKFYIIDPFDEHQMDYGDKANKWQLAAYASGRTTYNDVPFSDGTGTYLAAYTPIRRDGKIVALLKAEYDSATFTEFQAIVKRAFWLSIGPAVLLALLLAYVLAAMFVEPMEIFRRIDETAAAARGGPEGADDPLASLSPRETEVAELVRRGLQNKEIAEQLVVGAETVKKHLKNIKDKTGFTRVDLAVHAEARRQAFREPARA